MRVNVYLAYLSLYSADEVESEFNKIKEHFISLDGSPLSKRKESLLGRILLHRCLVGMGTQNYTAEYTKNKKPQLICGKQLYFNVSHSGDYVALAVGECEVGCDVQEYKEYNPRLAKKCCHDSEIRLIEASQDKGSVFISMWALKESILKFKGDGISGGLSTYDFSDFVNMDEFEAYDCRFCLKKLDDAYLALCHKGDEVSFVTLKENILKGDDNENVKVHQK